MVKLTYILNPNVEYIKSLLKNISDKKSPEEIQQDTELVEQVRKNIEKNKTEKTTKKPTSRKVVVVRKKKTATDTKPKI